MDESFERQYNIAVDLGTTTVELAIVDSNYKVIDTDYFLNPQKLYGKDLINRINTVTRDTRFIKIMKDMFIKSFQERVTSILSSNNINLKSVDSICICGNTTMISILLEYDITELGIYPFEHRLDTSVNCNSKELFGYTFPIDCNMILSGCASAFIGGDVLAGLVAIEGNDDSTGVNSYLFLDLGTNGEMVLYHNNSYYTASCACGPAFEASCRAANIYGSNIIDSIVLGIKSGNISREGILKEYYIDKGINIQGIHITADILRDILLAKAAIRTSIDILLQQSGLRCNNIERVYVAGGFGFHLNIDNAIFMGLFPELFKEKIKVLGNTSLKGAIELLKTPSKIKYIDDFSKGNVKLIQMANLPDYQDRLLDNMYFK